MGKRKIKTIGIVTFVVTLIITTFISFFYLTNAAATRREKAQFLANSISERIEAEIESREYITRILEIEIANEDGDLTQQEFQTMGEALFNDYIDVISVSLAPNGVISYIYPLDNGIAERKNLFEDSVENVYAENSMRTGLSSILAPVTLADGSYGVIIRRPVFLGEKNADNFWGFASITLGLSDFLSEVNIKALADEGYEYKLIGNNMLTGDDRIIMEYSEKELGAPISSMISTVGGDYWTLMISPIGNWMDLHEIVIVFLIGLLFSVLTSVAISSYMSVKENAGELAVLSYTDSLTNLHNPRSYKEHTDDLISKKSPFGIIYIDLNDFKAVNDTYGHEVGDGLLNVVAKRLLNSIREKDIAFRMGGDEFVVVIHGKHDRFFYEDVITRIRANVARDVTVGDVTLKVMMSAGFARFPDDGVNLEDVVKKADDAMYSNKRLIKARRFVRGDKSVSFGRDDGYTRR
ncbi:MAG: sensor domain-containing diguanylate cyclase [Butyrivibrio sp.]|nr:sensor domain-containing diguanylate cyclase [Butyrivibrio sp.]